MRFKVVALITRKPGMAWADFLAHYENNHVKLVWRVFPQVTDYRRNFVDMTGAIMAPGMPDPDFDSITEIWYRDRAGYDEMLASHFAPELEQTMQADEERFMDRTKTRFFIVDERGATAAADPGKAPPFKVVALLSCKPGLSKADFIDYYETRHVPLIRSKFDTIVEYRRNFVDLSEAILAEGVAPPDFDVITELWFANRADYEKMLAAHAIPEIGQAIADDEANFLARSKTRFFVVDEHAER
jgi:hypothetical protein